MERPIYRVGAAKYCRCLCFLSVCILYYNKPSHTIKKMGIDNKRKCTVTISPGFTKRNEGRFYKKNQLKRGKRDVQLYRTQGNPPCCVVDASLVINAQKCNGFLLSVDPLVWLRDIENIQLALTKRLDEKYSKTLDTHERNKDPLTHTITYLHTLHAFTRELREALNPKNTNNDITKLKEKHDEIYRNRELWGRLASDGIDCEGKLRKNFKHMVENIYLFITIEHQLKGFKMAAK
jgi:hypothetical protein